MLVNVGRIKENVVVVCFFFLVRLGFCSSYCNTVSKVAN